MLRRTTFLLALVLLAAACGPGGRDAVLSRTLVGATAASKVYDSIDNAGIQARIIAAAPTKQAADEALADYRSKRDKAGLALVAVFTAIGVASVDPTAASVQSALDALKAALDALKQIGATP